MEKCEKRDDDEITFHAWVVVALLCARIFYSILILILFCPLFFYFSTSALPSIFSLSGNNDIKIIIIHALSEWNYFFPIARHSFNPKAFISYKSCWCFFCLVLQCSAYCFVFLFVYSLLLLVPLIENYLLCIYVCIVLLPLFIRYSVIFFCYTISILLSWWWLLLL